MGIDLLKGRTVKRLLLVGGVSAALLFGIAAPASAAPRARLTAWECTTKIVVGADGVPRRVTLCHYAKLPARVVDRPAVPRVR